MGTLTANGAQPDDAGGAAVGHRPAGVSGRCLRADCRPRAGPGTTRATARRGTGAGRAAHRCGHRAGLALVTRTLPDGTFLISERGSGLIKEVIPGGTTRTVGRVDGVVPGGEGGLLGLASLTTACVGDACPGQCLYLYAVLHCGRTTGSCGSGWRTRREAIHWEPPPSCCPAFQRPATTTAAGSRSVRTACCTSPRRRRQEPSGAGPGLARRQDPAADARTASPRPATRSRAARSGRWATATCRAWRGTRGAGCGPRSSARTPGTSST